MSRCSAGAVWNDQKKCKYADKSTVRNHCMYFIEAIGGHCDCAEAQRELRNTANKGKDWSDHRPMMHPCNELKNPRAALTLPGGDLITVIVKH